MTGWCVSRVCTRRPCINVTPAAVRLLLCLCLSTGLALNVRAAAVRHAFRGDRKAQQPPLATSTAPAASEEGEMVPVKPFLADGTVLGPASRELQEQFRNEWRAHGSSAGYGDGAVRSSSADASGTRKLLHGPRRHRAYPVCRVCRAVRCRRASGRCSGHCRRGRRLFDCSVTQDVIATCPQPPLRILDSLPPRDLGGGRRCCDSMVLTAAAPFIGCAITADKPSGCPPPGTAAAATGLMQPGTITVINSTCKTGEFRISCFEPYIPFGSCDCVYRVDVPGSETADFSQPCTTSMVPEWSGEGETVVEARGNFTVTEVSHNPIPDINDIASFMNDVVVDTNRGDAAVRQELFTAITFAADTTGRQSTSESDHSGGDYTVAEPPSGSAGYDYTPIPPSAVIDTTPDYYVYSDPYYNYYEPYKLLTYYFFGYFPEDYPDEVYPAAAPVNYEEEDYLEDAPVDYTDYETIDYQRYLDYTADYGLYFDYTRFADYGG